MSQFARRGIQVLLFLISMHLVPVLAQDAPKAPTDHQVPVATQWLLDAAGPTQRSSIKSVYLLVCPKTNKKGTAFLIKTGMVVTDDHVVDGCQSDDLRAMSPTGDIITFSKMVTDSARDLALLKPSNHIDGGLSLGNDPPLKAGETVTTWGFPLIYNGPAPLLTVGYIAGFEAIQAGNKTVKHLVVNGAFNPGNSGGPLLLSGQDTVVGIVVWKMRILAPWTQTLITGLSQSNSWVSSGVTQTLPNGTTRSLGQHEVTALVLQEFYNTVQIMIGEATAVSELKDFIREKGGDLQ
jgi:hypothetical protein